MYKRCVQSLLCVLWDKSKQSTPAAESTSVILLSEESLASTPSSIMVSWWTAVELCPAVVGDILSRLAPSDIVAGLSPAYAATPLSVSLAVSMATGSSTGVGGHKYQSHAMVEWSGIFRYSSQLLESPITGHPVQPMKRWCDAVKKHEKCPISPAINKVLQL
jgi:hypothetical protein